MKVLKLSWRSAVILFLTASACLPACAANPADVYLFAGQSNSAGFGMGKETLPAELQATFPKVQMWTPFARERKGDFTPLQPGVNSNHPNSMWACESQIGYRLENEPAQTTPVFFVKFAVGGAPLEPRAGTKNWHPSEKGKLYDGFRETLARALDRMKETGFEPRFKAFVWVQGETEIQRGPEIAAQYGTWLKDLIAAVRKDTNTPALDIVVVRINKLYKQASLANGLLAVEQGRVAAADDHVFLVDNHYPLLNDITHYTAAAHQGVGDDVLAVLKGKYPQVTPEITAGQKFSLPAGSANGFVVGTVKLGNDPKPEARWSTNSPLFAIDAFTGRITVADETKLVVPQMVTVPIVASNGTKDVPVNVSVTITPSTIPNGIFDVPAKIIAALPAKADTLLLDGTKITEIRDEKTSRKFVAPFPRTRFVAATGEGTPLGLNEGDTGFVMQLDTTPDKVWTPDESDSFVVSTVIRPETSTRKSSAIWTITNGQRRSMFGASYNYAAARFELRFTDNLGRINGANAEDKSSPADATYVVTLIKTGNDMILRVNGKEAAKVQNTRWSVVTKEDGTGGFYWAGSQANAGEITGKAGSFFLANGPVTKAALTAIEKQLAQSTGVALAPG